MPLARWAGPTRHGRSRAWRSYQASTAGASMAAGDGRCMSIRYSQLRAINKWPAPLVNMRREGYSILMAKDDLPEPKRRNRTMNIADVLSGALDPVLKKRGFASR